MDHEQDLIRNKVQFLKTDLELTKTLINMAKTEKELSNTAQFLHLKWEITKALDSLSAILADSRVLVPEQDNEQIRKEMATCRTAYDAL